MVSVSLAQLVVIGPETTELAYSSARASRRAAFDCSSNSHVRNDRIVMA